MFYIQFERENQAFIDDKHGETIRVLKDVIERIKLGDESGRVRDTNGNTIGSFGIKK